MIGVFDSGYGGLTVLKKIIQKLPQYDYAYLGDNARAPYGDKSQDIIFEYTCEALEFLFRQGCELVILACNTASAKALRRVQQTWLPEKYPRKRVLGVLIPAVEEAFEHIESAGKKTGKIGILGTRATIESGAYEQELKKIMQSRQFGNKITIISRPAPLLVPLVEEGWAKSDIAKKVLRSYLRPIKNSRINVLILGCTHYPFLIEPIRALVNKRVKIIDTPSAVAGKLSDYLKRHAEIESKLSTGQTRKFFTTNDEKKFAAFAKNYLQGYAGGEVRKINIGRA